MADRYSDCRCLGSIWLEHDWNIIVRRVQHIYAAIWWYLATFLGVAILHVVNSFELPISLFKSYTIYAGAQDAVVQWWYGHNAVAFFLTTPFPRINVLLSSQSSQPANLFL